MLNSFHCLKIANKTLNSNIMKKIVAVLIFLFLVIDLCAQNLSLNEIILLQTKNVNYLNSYLTKKGWEFDGSEVNKEENYKLIKWAFNKNTYNDKAERWFYLYQYKKLENQVSYQTSKTIFNKIKATAQRQNYKLFDSQIIENGIRTKYKKGSFELVLLTSKTNSETSYIVHLYNFREYEEKMNEELQKEIAAMEFEFLYNTYINNGDSLFKHKKYKQSKIQYKEALEMKPNEKYPSVQLSKVNSMLDFFKERKTKIYNYKDLNSNKYQMNYNNLINNIKEELKKVNYEGEAKLNVKFIIDTIGNIKINYDLIENNNDKILDIIKAAANKTNIQKVKKKEYYVAAKAGYFVNVKMNKSYLKIEKDYNELSIIEGNENLYSEVSSFLSNSPIGKYEVQIIKNSVNSVDFYQKEILDYKGTGGPSNMFLSLLVPGLGVKKVTGGKKSGSKRTLYTYGLLASGICCKLLSNSQYDKYHDATTLMDMDNYYNRANNFNKGFVLLTGAGVALWIYDIVWVANKGFSNKARQKNYKKNLNVNILPESNGISFSYKINL